MVDSISILGYGFVGKSCGYLCEKNNIEFNVYDPILKQGSFNYFDNLEKLINYVEVDCQGIHYIIICVPTPSDSEGNCDISIINNLLEDLNKLITKETYILIKSTVVPGTCKKFNEKFNSLNIIFFPEFLRAATCFDDIYNAKFVLLGIPENFCLLNCQKILKIIRRLYSHNNNIEIILKNYEECEVFKYTLNTYFATKITFFNEIYDLCEKMNVDYQDLKQLFKYDSRIGNFGIHVPGPDGNFGFSGVCLPKEIRGMIKLQENLGLSNEFMKCVDKRNVDFRKKND